MSAVIGLLFGANAQSNVTELHQATTVKQAKVVGDHIDRSSSTAKPAHFLNNGNRGGDENLLGSQIGTTTYDLQTNSANPNRLVVNADGKIQATWTGSSVTDAQYADRGTYYNYYNGSEWTGAVQERLEGSASSQRSGWPSNAFTAEGEIIISHNPATGKYNQFMMTRPVAGTGDWTTKALTEFSGIWPRIATVGDTVYVVYANTTGDTDNDDYKTVFARSYDMGATWDTVNMLLPGLDTSVVRMGGDIYSIRAKGSNVYIVSGATTNNLMFWKSTDYGQSFTMTTILDLGLGDYDISSETDSIDVNNDQVIDTIISHDGAPDLIIDANGQAHVWTGKMFITDDGTGAGYSYFPGVMGLLYWNESFGADSIQENEEVKVIDLNESGGNSFVEGSTLYYEYGNGNAMYGIGGISTPSAALDPLTGKIYVVYTAPSELTDLDIDLNVDDQLPYREIYGYVGTPDSAGKFTWTPPVNLTNSARLFYENMFPQVADLADGKVHMMWQRDDNPGIAVGEGAIDVVKENNIIYHAFDYTSFANAAPKASFDTTTLSCATTKFEAIVLSGDVRSFRWDFGDGLISTEREPTHTYTAQGNYDVKLTVSNPWGSSDTTITISKPCVGIEELSVANTVAVYPNPTEGNLSINLTTFENSDIQVSIFNTLGSLVSVQNVNSVFGTSSIDVDLANQTNGVYFVQIKVANEVITKKVTLNK